VSTVEAATIDARGRDTRSINQDIRRAIEPHEPEHHLDALNYRVIAASLKPDAPARRTAANGSAALTDDIFKALRAPLARQCDVGHLRRIHSLPTAARMACGTVQDQLSAAAFRP